MHSARRMRYSARKSLGMCLTQRGDHSACNVPDLEVTRHAPHLASNGGRTASFCPTSNIALTSAPSLLAKPRACILLPWMTAGLHRTTDQLCRNSILSASRPLTGQALLPVSACTAFSRTVGAANGDTHGDGASRQRTVPSFHRALLRTKLGVAWSFSTDFAGDVAAEGFGTRRNKPRHGPSRKSP